MSSSAASYTFQDLSAPPDSSTATTTSEADANPYQQLITSSSHSASNIQSRYSTHRETRNGQQRDALCSDTFEGLITDDILHGLVTDPEFRDERKCLVYWARPTGHVRALVEAVQSRIHTFAPKIWLMPQDNLHMTVLEIAHSMRDEQISALVDTLSSAAGHMTAYTLSHRARLTRPMVVYDSRGLALSYLPAAGECLASDRQPADDEYTYHHLRRDIHRMALQTGAPVASRYVVPSAHLTIGRFICAEDFRTSDGLVDHDSIKDLCGVLDEINDWLRKEYWPIEGETIKPGGEWLIGQERGLDFRFGDLWYGGGKTVRLGQGY